MSCESAHSLFYMPFSTKLSSVVSTTPTVHVSTEAVVSTMGCHGSYQPHNNPTAGHSFSLSRSLALSFHGRRQWTVKRFDIRVRARSGQLRGAASNFEAGEVGTGKREGGLPAHQAARAPRLRASRRLPKWALIILNRSLPASTVFEFFCLGKTRSTSLPASVRCPRSLSPCGH